MSTRALEPRDEGLGLPPPGDMDANAPPWERNPSAWRQRVPICILAGIAFVISTYMALYQWRLIDGVWDPVFGEESQRVLDSAVSERMRSWIGIPDAALGAIAYLGDLLFGIGGSTRRWQYRPWLVVVFGIDVIPLGIVSAVLVVLQGTVVGSWCFLCLVTAVISLTLVLLAYDEVWSSLRYIAAARRAKEPWWPNVWRRFWGAPPERAHATDEEVALPSRTTWPRTLELCLGCWLIASIFVFGHDPSSAVLELSCGAALVVLPLLALWPPLQRVHLLELVVAGWLLVAGWGPAVATQDPMAQNHIIVGLLVAMLAILPTAATAPPKPWRASNARARRGSPVPANANV